MQIAIGADHGGFLLKKFVCDYFITNKIKFNDFGINNQDACDYPDIAQKICEQLVNNNHYLGILICGTGVGMSIAANKISGVRAVCCSEPYSAKLARMHNNANVLCIGGRVLGNDVAIDIVHTFLNTQFSNEERHTKRITKIRNLEQF